nr:major capsid protein [Streptomyces sp. NBC_00830]WTB35136.1 major capsid protein [Streptomyces sp. NBC_00830]
MTIADLIKGVTVQDLTTFAREIPTPADFLLTQSIFPKVKVADVMWRIKNQGRYVNAAKYRSYDASVVLADRQAWTTSTQGMLPALGQKLPVGEMEILLQEASRGADQDRLIELLYDDVERHVEAVNSRLELAAGDVLTDGKFSLAAENGLTQDVDFLVPAANMPTAPVLWNDPTSDPIKDELGWLDYLDTRSPTRRPNPNPTRSRNRSPSRNRPSRPPGTGPARPPESSNPARTGPAPHSGCRASLLPGRTPPWTPQSSPGSKHSSARPPTRPTCRTGTPASVRRRPSPWRCCPNAAPGCSPTRCS